MISRLFGAIARRMAVGALVVATAQVAVSAQIESAFTVATRYDEMGHVTGTIKPDPDGSGPLRLLATRYTYSQGLLSSVETGTLTSWPDETVAPANWGSYGFSGANIFGKKVYTPDAFGRKFVEQVQASDGTIVSATQWSYTPRSLVWCAAVRMNVALFSSLPTDVCAPGAAGTQGPDRITRFTYDGFDQVLTEERGVGTADAQTYVARTYTNRQLNSETDASNNETDYTYYPDGRLQRIEFPSATTKHLANTADYEEYVYDNVGNRTSLRKRDGSIILYQFDALNRLSFKDIPGGTADDVYYKYDLRNLELSEYFGLVSGSGPSTIGISSQYDGFGRLSSVTNNSDGYTKTLAYSYDSDGNRLKVSHSDGVAFTYGYDGLDRAQYICESTAASSTPCTAAASPIITVVYDDHGRLTTLSRGASVAKSSYNYDTASRLNTLSLDLDGAATTNDVSFGFTYLPSGQIGTRSISISAFAANTVTASTSYVPNGLNQYTTILGATTASPLWDANGNLKSDGLGTNYTYDVENRLTAVTGARTANLDYDPKGRLLLTSTGTSTSENHFLYDGNALIAEYNSSGTLLRRYVHGLNVDEPLVWYEGATVGSANRYYLFANHQGSIAAIANSAGAKTQINTYDAYGIPGSGNAGRFQYTGQILIPEIGMYYYKARIYNPTLGRFMQTDPIGYKDDIDLYTYVGNDPLDKTDPQGLSSLDFDGSEHTITFTTSDGTTTDYPAYNNVDSKSNGKWPDGSYSYDGHTTHKDDAPNSAFGSNGNYKFNVPGRTDMGVHSGRETIKDRAGRKGPEHATEGCIRTTDTATAAIKKAADSGDPLTTITVRNNSPATPPPGTSAATGPTWQRPPPPSTPRNCHMAGIEPCHP